MKRLWPIAKWCLIVWGIVCVFAVLGIAGLVAYRVGPGNLPKTDYASPHDVRFVLNWCELGDDRITEVIHSYRSGRSLTGDHLDAYAIRISHVDIDELQTKEFGRGWYRCDQAQGVPKDAIEFISGWLHRDEIPWFLSSEEIRSEEVYVYPWSTYFSGTRPISTQLIFIRPRDKMVFYISCKT